MTKFSDTQAVILSTASQRDDLSILPLPETPQAHRRRAHQGPRQPQGQGPDRASGHAPRRRSAAAAHHPRRPAGDRRRARGHRQHAGPGHGRATGRRLTRRRRPRRGQEPQAPAEPAQAATAPAAAKRKAKARKPAKAAPAEKPTPRAGTKQAQMIELLKRPEGATVEQIAAATGWQHHTIRGAITGALKKKLGPHVEATPHPRGRPQQDRRQGQQHRLPDRRGRLIRQNPPPMPPRRLAPGGGSFHAAAFWQPQAGLRPAPHRTRLSVSECRTTA